ncbi:MAG: hypothetical protein JWP48_2908 [Actinoallomurus sp.]|jgi:hypothetical protein|nr:hypothetical protein [Actinoallomurus sp.]
MWLAGPSRDGAALAVNRDQAYAESRRRVTRSCSGDRLLTASPPEKES